MGESTRSAARTGSMTCSAPRLSARATARLSSRIVSRGRTALSSRTGVSAEPAPSGTPAWPSSRRTESARPDPRTTTAMSVQGTPSTRWARRSSDAMCAVSWAAERNSATSTRPGAADATTGSTLVTPAEGADAARHPVRDLDEGRGQPVRALEHHGLERLVRHCGRRERLPPGGDEARVGAAEGLDRDVRVTEQDDAGATHGDDAEQPHGRRGQFLGLVDDDEPDSLVQPVEGAPVLLEQVADRGEQPGGVVGAVPAQGRDLVVLAQHPRRRDPLGPCMVLPQLGELVRPLRVLDGPHEQIAQLVAEAAGRQRLAQLLRPLGTGHLTRGVPGEQVAQHDVLLRTVQQAGSRLAAQHRLGAQHPEAEGLPRAGEGLGAGAAQTRRHLLPELGRGAAARRQQEARVGANALGAHRLCDDLDRQGRLAGAGSPEHAKNRGGGVQDCLLARVELHSSRCGCRSATEDDHRWIPSRPADTRSPVPWLAGAVALAPGRTAYGDGDDEGLGTALAAPSPSAVTSGRHLTSKRSASMTLAQAATKSRTNFSLASSLA